MSARSPAALAEHLVAALDEIGAGVVVLPAPLLDPLAILRGVRKGDAWWLERASSEESVLGLGEAIGSPLPARGGAALDALVSRARELPLSRHPEVDASLAARFPLVLFGHAFADGSGADDPWLDHRDGRTAIPRWTYVRIGERAALAFTCTTPPWPGRAALLGAELEAILGASVPVHREARPARLEPSSAAVFHARVERARDAIARGALTKVVCSRRAAVSAEHDLGAEEVLSRLPSPGLRFFVRRGASALLGATPERLFRKEGTRVGTEALAGTRAEGPLRAERALLASTKDLAEHAPVVDAIVTRLEAIGARVRCEGGPRLKHANNVVHLRTEIDAQLPDGTSAVTLLEALHPTPAVGGAPRAQAEAFIRVNEPPRGWYSGPVGWIDARGDADVHVMLRCAVVRGARAWVFAGGGIVASSDPAAELAETELKMAPVLRALGVETPADTRPDDGRSEHRATPERGGAETRA